MSAKSNRRQYSPKPEQMALWPDVSGNAINGLGESVFRRPEPVYWHDPDRLTYGALQRWFYTQNPDNPAIDAARSVRAKIIDAELPPVAGEPAEYSAEDWTTRLKTHAETLDLELFGIARVNQDWVFDGYEVNRKFILMIGVAHDYERMKHAPEDIAGAEVIRQYGRGLRAAKDLAGWIRAQGWDADPHGGPWAGPMVLIPPAIECGFGELGKHGSIINRDYGSSFRLACVLTDVPLVPTKAKSYGVDDFCSRCQVCANACPPDAILPDKEWVRGAKKWYVDFDKCLPYFNENFGCGICIAVCPWSIPGRGPRIVEQLARRASKKRRES